VLPSYFIGIRGFAHGNNNPHDILTIFSLFFLTIEMFLMVLHASFSDTMPLRIVSILLATIFHLSLTTALSQTCLPNTVASSGCNKPAFLPGLTQYRFNLQSSGKSRSYSYHLPSTYNSSTPYPIVVGFHGSSSIGAFFELDTKLSEGRYSGDKIMVYPNGIDGSWAGPSYHKTSSSTIQEDIQFVADMLTDITSKFCVDEFRVYGVGYFPLLPPYSTLY
jgi:predicted peptidase